MRFPWPGRRSPHLDKGGVRDSQSLTSLQRDDPLGSLSWPTEQRIEPAYSLVRAVLEQPAEAGQREGEVVVSVPVGVLAIMAGRRDQDRDEAVPQSVGGDYTEPGPLGCRLPDPAGDQRAPHRCTVRTGEHQCVQVRVDEG